MFGWLNRLMGTAVIGGVPETPPKTDLFWLFKAKSYRCPDCGGTLLTGAEGGSAVNVTCGDCEARFNIGVAFGEPFFIERI